MKNLIPKLTLLFLVFLFVTVLTAQEKEKRTVGDFSAINVTSGIDLYLTQSDTVNIEVICDKSVLHRLITKVEGNTLKVYMRSKISWNWSNNEVPKVYVSYKEINALSANGGADIYGQNLITTSKLSIKSSDGADIYAEVKTDKLEVTSSGGSDIKIKGTTNILTASAGYGSDINARELKAQRVTVNSSGGADVSVWVEKEITANARGGSVIDYYGNPEIKSLSESGAGDINHR